MQEEYHHRFGGRQVPGLKPETTRMPLYQALKQQKQIVARPSDAWEALRTMFIHTTGKAFLKRGTAAVWKEWQSDTLKRKLRQAWPDAGCKGEPVDSKVEKVRNRLQGPRSCRFKRFH